MKTNKFVLYVLMFLPTIITIIALFYMPDIIPAHYDINGQVTRFGSKYESLILPIFTILFGYFMLLTANYSVKKEGNTNNYNVTIICANLTLLLFNIMNIYFLSSSIKEVINLNDYSIDIYTIISIFTGIMLIIIGNVMPKTKKNNLIGLRTTWSLKNDTTWKKSQLFGGIIFIIDGIMILLLSFIFDGITLILLLTLIIITSTIIATIYTYIIAKKFE